MGFGNLLGRDSDVLTVTGGRLGKGLSEARPVRAQVLTWAGIVLVLSGIALPWWTFEPTMWSGGPTAHYGWQFGVEPLVLAAAVLPVVIAEVMRRPSRARLAYSILLLVLVSASLLLSWLDLRTTWSANCHVECFGPGPATPGIGFPVVVIGAVLVLAANAPSLWYDKLEQNGPQ